MSSTSTSINTITKKIAVDFPVATMPASYSFEMGDLSNWDKVSVQIGWKDLTKTLDGNFGLQQSNDLELVFEDISAAIGTITTANGVQTLEQYQFGGKYLNLSVDKVGITGGTLSVKIGRAHV